MLMLLHSLPLRFMGFTIICIAAFCRCARPEIALDAEPFKQDALIGRYRPELGVGVDFAETRTYRRCVTTPTHRTHHAFARQLYYETAIKDRADLDSALGVEAAVSAKGLWGSATGSFSYFKQTKISSDAFYWLVNADYRLLDEGIDTGDSSFALTDEAQRILQGPRGLVGFYEACGEHFYSGTRLGARYALLYEFKSTQTDAIERIKTSASYGGFGVDAKASFEKLANQAQRASVLTVYSEVTGGSNRLASYALSPEYLEKELEALRDDLYNQGRGVATEWFISDYDMFAEVQEAKADIINQAGSDAAERMASTPRLFKDWNLAVLYKLFHRNIDYSQRLNALITASREPEPIREYSSSKIAEMLARMTKIEELNSAVAQRAKECIMGREPECRSSDLTEQAQVATGVPEVDFPPDRIMADLQGWELTGAQSSTNGRYFLDFIARSPGMPTQFALFKGGTILGETSVGVVVPANAGIQHARIIGTTELVRDPVHGQLRPNLCIYQYASACNLRLIPTGSVRVDGFPVVKLQLTLFDEYGFIQSRYDLPDTL